MNKIDENVFYTTTINPVIKKENEDVVDVIDIDSEDEAQADKESRRVLSPDLDTSGKKYKKVNSWSPLPLQANVKFRHQTKARRTSSRVAEKAAKDALKKKDDNDEENLTNTKKKEKTKKRKAAKVLDLSNSDDEKDVNWTPKILDTKEKKKPIEKTTIKNENIESEDEEAEKRELTEYELIRQRNIAERMKLFEELQLGTMKAEIEAAFKKTPAKKSRNTLPRPKSPLPRRRKSMRIEGIKATEPLRAAARAKAASNSFSYGYDWSDIARNNKIDLPFTEVLMPNFGEDDCKAFMIDTCLKIQDLKPENTLRVCNIETFKQTMDELSLQEYHKMKLVPNRIYSLAIHPTYLGVLVAAGCKTGAVGLWGTNLEYKETDDLLLATFNYHVRPASCISFGENEPHVLYTTSYDGTTRRGDLQSEKFSLVYATDEEERDGHLGWHCELSPGVLLIGHGNGNVGRVDMREPQGKATLFKCHDRSVRTISLHPVSRQHIATASSFRRRVSIWDLRVMSSANVLKAELSALQFSKPPTSAFFSPISGSRLLTTSYDDNISIFSCGDLSAPRLHHKIHHYNQTGRWITNFKAVWHPQREDVFIVGSMDRPRRLEIYHAGANKPQILTKLRHEELFSTIGAVARFHPTLPAVVAGNASGYVHLFMK